MSKSEKIIKLLSDFVENGILSSQDVKKEILTNFKFKKDDLIDKLDLVSREEFEVLKKVIARQEIEIKKLSKKKLKRQGNFNR
jgi:BMFP domain-containing protein YqiC